MKNFISVEDVPDLSALLRKAQEYKAQRFKDKHLGEGKTIGMLFFNPSMRTRISTQVAARNLGMEVIVFNVEKDGWQIEFADGAIMKGDKTEHVKEAAAVLGQYLDVLAIRSFPKLMDRNEDYSEQVMRQFVKYSKIPVLSLESATLHPLQSLADVMTIQETFKEVRKPKVVMTWAPHVKVLPQAVPNSFAQWINAWGQADFVIVQPEGYEIHEPYSGNATIEYNQEKALQGADYVYVKNWSSYKTYGKIIRNDISWMMNNKKLALTNDAKVMHCLPVRRNLVIAEEVLDGPNSIVVEQAGNRVWAAQAVLSELLKG